MFGFYSNKTENIKKFLTCSKTSVTNGPMTFYLLNYSIAWFRASDFRWNAHARPSRVFSRSSA